MSHSPAQLLFNIPLSTLCLLSFSFFFPFEMIALYGFDEVSITVPEPFLTDMSEKTF